MGRMHLATAALAGALLARCTEGSDVILDAPREEAAPAEAIETMEAIETAETPDARDAADTFRDAPDGADAPAEGECTGPSTSPAGGACGDDCDCAAIAGLAPRCLAELAVISLPGGYCTAPCPSAGSCGAGAECVDIFSLARYCMKRCSTVAECRGGEGYVCDVIPMISDTNTYCIPQVS